MPDAERLAARVLEIVDVASESRSEAALVEHVLAELSAAPGGGAVDAGDTCVLAGTTRRSSSSRPLVLLAGHLDTVPAQGNFPGRLEDGVVHGLGAADMKGSIGIMMELALAPPPELTVDLGFVFFGREELPFGDSALTPLLAREPGLLEADLAIVMEPTGGALHAGCVGNINATWTFRGVAGHSARPWLADNAIHRAGVGIAALASLEPVDHVFAGLTFREVVSAVTVHGGVARNVVPDECVVEVNLRYAPGTSAAEAEAKLHALCDEHGELVIDGNAPSGAVSTGDLVARLRAAGPDGAPLALEPKQAWTPVAEFTGAGVDAINYGPGLPLYAHRRDEQVAVDALVESYNTLVRFLCA